MFTWSFYEGVLTELCLYICRFQSKAPFGLILLSPICGFRRYVKQNRILFLFFKSWNLKFSNLWRHCPDQRHCHFSDVFSRTTFPVAKLDKRAHSSLWDKWQQMLEISRGRKFHEILTDRLQPKSHWATKCRHCHCQKRWKGIQWEVNDKYLTNRTDD